MYMMRQTKVPLSGKRNNVDKNHEGRFKPVYSNNGTECHRHSSVNNSEGIIVRKLWVDRNGRTITPPNDVNSTSAMALVSK